jgi:hypothetical protein
MQQPSLIQIAAHMVAEVTQRGQTPLTFLMNSDTSNRIASELAGEVKHNMPATARFWLWLRRKPIQPKLTHLCGVPITEAPHIPIGRLFLQVFAQPGAPQGQMAVPGGVPAEFVKREPVATPAEIDSEVRPTLDEIASSNGRPSCSDVIMRAMDGVDNLNGIAIVRLYKNGHVDLCANIEKYALQGVLQHAQMWVIQNGQG